MSTCEANSIVNGRRVRICRPAFQDLHYLVMQGCWLGRSSGVMR
jgi:hypothetical protein